MKSSGFEMLTEDLRRQRCLIYRHCIDASVELELEHR